MKVVYRLLMAVLLGVFLFSGWKVVTLSMEYLKSGESYAELEHYVSLQTLPSATNSQDVAEESESWESAASTPENLPETVPAEEPVLWPMVNFDALAEINPDIAGWIYLPDSKINYPIVWRDNEFYLDHLFTGEYNAGGCIFLDERCFSDFSDTHSILYGHHMKDGSMFAGIRKFRDQAYYDAHPTAMLVTPEGNFWVHFFSGYVASTDQSAWKRTFSEGEYWSWLDEITRKSYFRADIAPTVDDRVLTLSTCSYEFDDARFVLHGVIVEAEP